MFTIPYSPPASSKQLLPSLQNTPSHVSWIIAKLGLREGGARKIPRFINFMQEGRLILDNSLTLFCYHCKVKVAEIFKIKTPWNFDIHTLFNPIQWIFCSKSIQRAFGNIKHSSQRSGSQVLLILSRSLSPV